MVLLSKLIRVVVGVGDVSVNLLTNHLACFEVLYPGYDVSLALVVFEAQMLHITSMSGLLMFYRAAF